MREEERGTARERSSRATLSERHGSQAAMMASTSEHACSDGCDETCRDLHPIEASVCGPDERHGQRRAPSQSCPHAQETPKFVNSHNCSRFLVPIQSIGTQLLCDTLIRGNFIAMLSGAICAALAFAPGPAFRPVVGNGRMGSLPVMAASPIDAIASPLNKWQAAVPDAAGAAAATPEAGALLQDLPFEVAALFAVIAIVGVGGLVKQSGLLDTIGEKAAAAGLSSAAGLLSGAGEAASDGSAVASSRSEEEEMADMSQAEKEGTYFKQIAEMQKEKRGGSAANRKKKSKSKKK